MAANIFIGIPLALGLVGALFLLAAGGTTVAVSLAALGLAAASLPAGRALSNRHATRLAAVRADAATTDESAHEPGPAASSPTLRGRQTSG